VVDIDGVIVKGRTFIGKAPAIIKSLLEPITDKRINIPFALLTNGGGCPEKEKAEDINRRLGIIDSEDGMNLREEHMILCHTPLRDQTIMERYRDKYVLVTGRYEELRVCHHYGYQKAIHVEELAAIYHD
jgi:ribonucleotide monophosphatase NagD (HAD superfamily)